MCQVHRALAPGGCVLDLGRWVHAEEGHHRIKRSAAAHNPDPIVRRTAPAPECWEGMNERSGKGQLKRRHRGDVRVCHGQEKSVHWRLPRERSPVQGEDVRGGWITARNQKSAWPGNEFPPLEVPQ